MGNKLIQLNFHYALTAEEYVDAVAPLANDFALVKGLKWKIWVQDEETSTGGGWYMFESDEALNDFMNGELFKQVAAIPVLSNFELKVFDVIESTSLITRAPL